MPRITKADRAKAIGEETLEALCCLDQTHIALSRLLPMIENTVRYEQVVSSLNTLQNELATLQQEELALLYPQDKQEG